MQGVIIINTLLLSLLHYLSTAIVDDSATGQEKVLEIKLFNLHQLSSEHTVRVPIK